MTENQLRAWAHKKLQTVAKHCVQENAYGSLKRLSTIRRDLLAIADKLK